MRIAIILLSVLAFISCSHQKSSSRAPSSVDVDSCHDLLASVVTTDWRELWDQQVARGLDGDEALDWVKENKQLNEIVSAVKKEDRAPIEHSYALIHAKNPDWSADQIAGNYKLWQTSCGI